MTAVNRVEPWRNVAPCPTLPVVIELEQYLDVAGDRVQVVQRGGDAPAPALVRLAEIATWIYLAYEPDVSPVPRTTLRGTRPHGRIELVGAIERRQLGPLVETLRALATGHVDSDTPATAEVLARIPRPTEVTAVVSPGCPYCPAITAAVLRFALLAPRVGVRVVRADVAGVPADVRAVPTVLVDERIVATGSMSEYALAERVWASVLAPAP